MLVASRDREMDLAFASALMVPVSAEPEVRFRLTVLMESAVTSPSSTCCATFSVTSPPFSPVLPHLSALAESRTPEAALSAAFCRFMTAWVFVM